MLRVLHTSDWHLGHTLHALPRDAEHAAFLTWLLEQVEAHQVDALLIAGDIFETANPPSRAMRAWYTFLAEARARYPSLDIVVIGGNHDSAGRLEAADPVLGALRIHIVGALSRDAARVLDVDRLVAPLTDAEGQVAAWVAAVPFLRTVDLSSSVVPGPADGDDKLIAGVRQVYAEALAAARARQQAGQALLAMGHCYMVGGALSELSERRVLGGNQHALPADIFPDDVAYVALGHLHRAQRVGRDTIRYAGSPIPLAVDEAPYPHQVRLVTLEGPAVIDQQALRVPRSIEVWRHPAEAAGPLDEVLTSLRSLPDRDDSPVDTWPYLEVRVILDGPRLTLRQDVDAVLADKRVRLVKLTVLRPGQGDALTQLTDARHLQDLTEQEVLERMWRRKYDADVPSRVLETFHELLDKLGQQGA